MNDFKSNKKYNNVPVEIPSSNTGFFNKMRSAFDNAQNNVFNAETNIGGVEHKTGYNLGVPGEINNFKEQTTIPKTKK